jgi:hypothetical protein
MDCLMSTRMSNRQCRERRSVRQPGRRASGDDHLPTHGDMRGLVGEFPCRVPPRGLIGEPRVNVLRLNLALDQLKSS